MDSYRGLLSRAHLSVVSDEDDAELELVADTIEGSVRVGGREELAALLRALLAARHERDVVVPKTLDLYGHSTARTAQLRLGDWVVDAGSATERAFFRELAEQAVLTRLGVTCVRLLACRTAGTAAGRATLCQLAELLGVEVYGTRHLLYDAHHDAHGFLDAWQFLLVSASELRREGEPEPDPALRGVGSLGVSEPRRDRAEAASPRRLARPRAPRLYGTRATVAELLRVIRHHDGAPIAAAVSPTCVLVLPSATRGIWHVVDVLFDGAFVRVYPSASDASDAPGGSDGLDDPDAAGVVYPVDDVPALRQIMAGLSRRAAG